MIKLFSSHRVEAEEQPLRGAAVCRAEARESGMAKTIPNLGHLLNAWVLHISSRVDYTSDGGGYPRM